MKHEDYHPKGSEPFVEDLLGRGGEITGGAAGSVARTAVSPPQFGVFFSGTKPQARREVEEPMITARKILGTKSEGVWSIGPQATAYEALQMMADKDVGALLVVDGESLVGVFSERDYARKVILKGKSSKSTFVAELMSTPVFYIEPDKTIEDCMALMSSKRMRHLPVMDGGALIGVISIGDVVNALITAQKVTIRDLENYITGSGYLAEEEQSVSTGKD
jgi:CBS domain-containing protein